MSIPREGRGNPGSQQVDTLAEGPPVFRTGRRIGGREYVWDPKVQKRAEDKPLKVEATAPTACANVAMLTRPCGARDWPPPDNRCRQLDP